MRSTLMMTLVTDDDNCWAEIIIGLRDGAFVKRDDVMKIVRIFSENSTMNLRARRRSTDKKDSDVQAREDEDLAASKLVDEEEEDEGETTLEVDGVAVAE
ncbi:hypothetical protein VNO78_19438 [Psophocarpus tetragonolobus]|uniref:Uncharacterized protein n=1 Tax=Psophocarpus tetragonolobus TaxID=3891 RepID=A0AAN9S9H5_PSOTE